MERVQVQLAEQVLVALDVLRPERLDVHDEVRDATQKVTRREVRVDAWGSNVLEVSVLCCCSVAVWRQVLGRRYVAEHV